MKIILRDIRPEDKELIRSWRNLPHVSKYMYTDHYITLEEHEQWFQCIFTDKTRRYWIVNDGQEDIGIVNLYNINEKDNRCNWAIYIARENTRGKGIGSLIEYSVLQLVFEELKLSRLACEVLASNQLAIELHKRFGFTQEGYLRCHIMKEGKPEDVVLLGILREEWELHRPEVEKRLQSKSSLS